MALQRQGQTLQEEDVETRYPARPLHLGPPSGWQCFFGKHRACVLFTRHGALAIIHHSDPWPWSWDRCLKCALPASSLSWAEGETLASGFLLPVHCKTEAWRR